MTNHCSTFAKKISGAEDGGSGCGDLRLLSGPQPWGCPGPPCGRQVFWCEDMTLGFENYPHSQVYDGEDYRRIRFVSRQKEVNENFAVDLIAEQQVSQVESRVISCDGGGGALGHPKVYIDLDKETKTGTCGYCGLQFKEHHHH